MCEALHPSLNRFLRGCSQDDSDKIFTDVTVVACVFRSFPPNVRQCLLRILALGDTPTSALGFRIWIDNGYLQEIQDIHGNSRSDSIDVGTYLCGLKVLSVSNLSNQSGHPYYILNQIFAKSLFVVITSNLLDKEKSNLNKNELEQCNSSLIDEVNLFMSIYDIQMNSTENNNDNSFNDNNSFNDDNSFNDTMISTFMTYTEEEAEMSIDRIISTVLDKLESMLLTGLTIKGSVPNILITSEGKERERSELFKFLLSSNASRIWSQIISVLDVLESKNDPSFIDSLRFMSLVSACNRLASPLINININININNNNNKIYSKAYYYHFGSMHNSLSGNRILNNNNNKYIQQKLENRHIFSPGNIFRPSKRIIDLEIFDVLCKNGIFVKISSLYSDNRKEIFNYLSELIKSKSNSISKKYPNIENVNGNWFIVSPLIVLLNSLIINIYNYEGVNIYLKEKSLEEGISYITIDQDFSISTRVRSINDIRVISLFCDISKVFNNSIECNNLTVGSIGSIGSIGSENCVINEKNSKSSFNELYSESTKLKINLKPENIIGKKSEGSIIRIKLSKGKKKTIGIISGEDEQNPTINKRINKRIRLMNNDKIIDDNIYYNTNNVIKNIKNKGNGYYAFGKITHSSVSTAMRSGLSISDLVSFLRSHATKCIDGNVLNKNDWDIISNIDNRIPPNVENQLTIWERYSIRKRLKAHSVLLLNGSPEILKGVPPRTVLWKNENTVVVAIDDMEGG